MTHFKITVVSDTVCPWCYMGKKRLDRGIALYRSQHPDTSADDTFVVEWRPFYLAPDAPRTGIDKAQRYRDRYGEARARSIWASLAAAGAELGLAFKFTGKTGNTRDSHRLIHLAGTKGPEVQNKLLDELFGSYFEREGDITSPEMLRAAAERAGLDAAEVKRLLRGDEFGDVVDAQVAEAERQGINSVPSISVNDVLKVSGALEPEGFVEMFEKVKQEEH